MNGQRPTLLVMAWLGTLLLSRLPQIVLRELLGIDPSAWIIWLWLGIGVTLVAFTFLWSTIKPLRGYFLILTAIWVTAEILTLLTTKNALWLGWFGSDKPWVVSFFGERLAAVLLALGLAVVLILLGQRRRDFFLAVGELNAPVEGLQRPGTNKPIRWTVVGPIVAVGLTTLFGIAILMLNPPKEVAFSKIIPLIPAILLFAVMNAFGEEFAYRAAPLSQLWAAVGKGQAIWMTGVWFGLGHYYGGIPSGPMGAVFLTLVAVLFGKAMLETKGIAMPVFIHFCGDLLIYVFLAMAS